jgi:hypothetical protein
MGRVVEPRFVGFDHDELGAVVDSFTRTLEREWTRAKVSLLESLAGDEGR